MGGEFYMVFQGEPNVHSWNGLFEDKHTSVIYRPTSADFPGCPNVYIQKDDPFIIHGLEWYNGRNYDADFRHKRQLLPILMDIVSKLPPESCAIVWCDKYDEFGRSQDFHWTKDSSTGTIKQTPLVYSSWPWIE
jgi:hypothetical protein